MTLVLENAIRSFDRETASLYEPTPEEFERRDPVDFSLATIYNFAKHYESLTPPNHPEWTCLPLHEPDSAGLTRNYLAYTNHSVHGEIIVHADASDHDFLSADAFEETPLARRLRFWHPDYVPETYPDYYRAPFDDSEPPRRTVDPEIFFDELDEYLTNERRVAIEQRRSEMADVDPGEVHDRGEDAIPELRCEGFIDEEDPTLALSIVFDQLEMNQRAANKRHHFVSDAFGIYEGDPVLLVPASREHSPDGIPVTATVESTSSTRITVRIDTREIDSWRSFRRYLQEERVGYGLIKLLNPLPFDRRAEAVDRVRADRDFREALTGNRSLTFTQPRAAQSKPKDAELNQEQQAAVRYALLADDLFCIHGPPGTGKTRTLVEVVRRTIDADGSVLVCADSNQAVDNLLVGDSTPGDPDEASLHAYGQHVGGEFTLDRRNVRRSGSDHVQTWYDSTPGDADVVAATNGSSATIDRQFDLVVIDEATQATAATSMVPLSKAQTAILAGDHRQLPPFSRTEEPPDSAFGLSLFEHVYGEDGVYEDIGLQLRTQYRMHRDIAYFPNREFYDRSLQTGVDIDPLTDWEPIVGYDLGGKELREGTSYANPQEAALVERLFDRFRDEGLDPEEIGVISPYTAQVRRIRNRLPQTVTVDTIDAFQGSERPVILISLVRSNSEGQIGFLGRPDDGPRRLNVAMTRAQRLCVLIGDWSTLRTNPGTEDVSDLYENLALFLRDTGRMRRFDSDLLSG